MSIRTKLAFAVLASSLCATSALAAPGNVTDLATKAVDGKTVISWTAPEGEIASYRLYYSSQSILDNEGFYDDFVETEGPVTEYTFDTPPYDTTYYVSVLAVDTAGEENGIFTSEVAVETQTDSGFDPATEPVGETDEVIVGLPENEPVALDTPEPAPAPAEPEASAGKLSLLSAEAVHPERVALTFSQPILVKDEEAPKAFAIVRPDGVQLRIKQMIIEGASATVVTEKQEKDVVYGLRLDGTYLKGTGGEMLDPASNSTFFTGHADGKTPGAEQPASRPETDAPADVENVNLTIYPDGNGTYTIRAQWKRPDVSGGLASYVIGQSFDQGWSFLEPQLIPADVDGIEIPGIRAGEFGLAVQTMNRFGKQSPGVFQTVSVPSGVQAWAPLQEILENMVARIPREPAPSAQPDRPVTPPTTPVDPLPTPPVLTNPSTPRLPNSGATLILLSMVSGGGFVGWRSARKRKK